MSDVVVKIDNLSKQYRLGTVGTGTLAHDLNRWWHLIRGRPNPYLRIGEVNNRAECGNSDYVWALRDVNLQVRRGEVLGIIGTNGAGKSTLLKILSRVTTPTTGMVKTKGRIASLLEVGTGFHPELTGRENIFQNGAILGMRKAEVRQKLDAIVDFSGCERYIDTPVKRYSSGMHVRLGFAVAAHLEPDILIVDEVLAVGDASFQKRCLGKMDEVSKSGRTVLFVSHNMAAVKELCRETVWLDQGSIRDFGESGSVVADYLKTAIPSCGVIERHFEKDLTKYAQVRRVRMVNEQGEGTGTFQCDQSVRIELLIQVHRPIPGMYGYLEIVRRDGVNVMMSDSFDDPPNPLDELSVGVHKTYITIPPRTLGPGEYSVYLNFTSVCAHNFQVDNPGIACTFKLDDHSSRRGNSRSGFFSTMLRWETKAQSEYVTDTEMKGELQNEA